MSDTPTTTGGVPTEGPMTDTGTTNEAVENARAAREATGLADTQAFIDSGGASYPEEQRAADEARAIEEAASQGIPTPSGTAPAEEAASTTTTDESEVILAGDALQERARELDIQGRSSMTADELRDAVAAAEAEAGGTTG